MDPDIVGGQAPIRRTRIPVSVILDLPGGRDVRERDHLAIPVADAEGDSRRGGLRGRPGPRRDLPLARVRLKLDEHLGGRKDSVVVRAAADANRMVLTLDRGVGDVRNFPPGSHAGVIVLRPVSQDPLHPRSCQSPAQRARSRWVQPLRAGRRAQARACPPARRPGRPMTYRRCGPEATALVPRLDQYRRTTPSGPAEGHTPALGFPEHCQSGKLSSRHGGAHVGGGHGQHEPAEHHRRGGGRRRAARPVRSRTDRGRVSGPDGANRASVGRRCG